MSLTQKGGRGSDHILSRPCSVAGFLAAGSCGRTRRHGRYLGEPRLGEARTVPHRLSALSLRAACEGGARPGPGLPCPLRRGHRHQLFARLLLQVGSGLRTGGTSTGAGQCLQSIQQRIRLHLLYTTAAVRLPPGPLGIYPAAAEFPSVSCWLCLPGLDPVLRAL